MGDGGRVPKRQEEAKRKLWRPWVRPFALFYLPNFSLIFLFLASFYFSQFSLNFLIRTFVLFLFAPIFFFFSWVGLLKVCQRQLNFRQLVELCFKFNCQYFLCFYKRLIEEKWFHKKLCPALAAVSIISSNDNCMNTFANNIFWNTFALVVHALLYFQREKEARKRNERQMTEEEKIRAFRESSKQ